MARTKVHALAALYAGLQDIVDDLANEQGAAGSPRVELSRPDEQFGDFASNVALMLAPVMSDNPKSVAQEIATRAVDIPGVASVDVAGPGFVNFTLDDAWFFESLAAIVAAGDTWGGGVVETAEKVLLEFVSANPTGPITAASGRHAALGDALARVMRFAGNDVATEYYVNDAGRQIQLFGESLVARATGADVPEDGYAGEYVVELSRELEVGPDADPEEVGARGVAKMVEQIDASMKKLGVHFDAYMSEKSLHDSSAVMDAVEHMKSIGQTFEEDGALWLRTTAFGDDKDRVLVRANGAPTYFAADVAYLKDKLDRGYGRAIYLLGADHHGYVARLKAAAAGLGHDPEVVEVLIMQMVHLIEAGEQKKMSKRRGDIVTIDDLIEQVGVDAVRFVMLQRSHDQSLDIDLDLAVEQTAKNPVYYVQYAHARIASIVRKAQDELGGSAVADAIGDGAAGSDEPLDPSERRLIKRLAEMPVVVRDAADKRAPHRIATYAMEVASDFTSFYRDCRVIGEGVTDGQQRRRLRMCVASQNVIARSLDLVGVHAPDKM